MVRLFDIVKKDRATSIDPDTGELSTYWRWKTLSLAISVASSFLFLRVDPNVFRTLISLYGILIGFGFSLLMFVVSQRIPDGGSKKHLKETAFRITKIEQLNEIIFRRVSLLVVLSILLVFLGFLLLAFSTVSLPPFGGGEDSAALKVLFWANEILLKALYILLIFLFFESLSAMFRLLKVVVFYFEYRLSHKL